LGEISNNSQLRVVAAAAATTFAFENVIQLSLPHGRRTKQPDAEGKVFLSYLFQKDNRVALEIFLSGLRCG